MADLLIPGIDISFYKDTERPLINKKLNLIKQTYGNYISNSSKISNVPENIIYSFIFIESAGNEKAVSPVGATGLMQIAPIAATDIIVMEHKYGRLNKDEISILSKYIDQERFNKIMSIYTLGSQIITKDDLFYPELNILIGTIYLGLLIDQQVEEGKIRMDKVVIRYNMGYFAYNKGKSLQGDTTALVSSLNKETSNYITKLVGTNGLLDIITSNG